jgi:hypothetical protein
MSVARRMIVPIMAPMMTSRTELSEIKRENKW